MTKRLSIFVRAAVILFCFVSSPVFGYDRILANKPSMAVLNLEAKEGISIKQALQASYFLREAFTKTEAFYVADSRDTRKVMDELKLRGCSDPSLALDIGRSSLRANRVVFGWVGQQQGKYVISVGMMDVEKGKMTNAATDEFSNFDENVVSLVVDIADRFVNGKRGEYASPGADINRFEQAVPAAPAVKLTVAVTDLSPKGVSAMDASVVSDFLRDSLINSGAYNVVERSNMEQILGEQRFQTSGCTTDECAVKMGKMLNVQRMIMGSLSKLGDLYYVSVRMVDVEKGTIVKAETISANTLGEIQPACVQLAAKLSGKKVNVESARQDYNESAIPAAPVSSTGMQPEEQKVRAVPWLAQAASESEAAPTPEKPRGHVHVDLAYGQVTGDALKAGKVGDWFGYYYPSVDIFNNPMGPSRAIITVPSGGGASSRNQITSDSGSQVDLKILYCNINDSFRVGGGMGYYYQEQQSPTKQGPALSLMAVNLFNPQSAQLDLSYYYATGYVSFQYGLIPKHVYLVFEPGFLSATSFGHLRASGYDANNLPKTIDFDTAGNMNIGSQLSFGVELYLGFFGIYAKTSVRSLVIKDALSVYNRETNTQMTYPMPDGSGNPDLDLSGTYTTIGVVLHL